MCAPGSTSRRARSADTRTASRKLRLSSHVPLAVPCVQLCVAPPSVTTQNCVLVAVSPLRNWRFVLLANFIRLHTNLIFFIVRVLVWATALPRPSVLLSIVVARTSLWSRVSATFSVLRNTEANWSCSPSTRRRSVRVNLLLRSASWPHSLRDQSCPSRRRNHRSLSSVMSPRTRRSSRPSLPSARCV